MSDNIETPQINLSINSIRLDSFEVKEAGTKLQGPLPLDGYEFGLSFNMETNQEEGLVVAKLTSVLKNKENKADLASISTVMEFKVTNVALFTRVLEDGTAQMLNTAMHIFASVIFSTTRGIFTMCAATTKFHNAYMPVVDMAKFLPLGEKAEQVK